MNVVDSSGWLEYLLDGPNATHFAEPIEFEQNLLVPTISIFEVFRVVYRQLGRESAGGAVDLMTKGTVVALTPELAATAAALAHDQRLAMADSIILATAQIRQAILWTQDIDLSRFQRVRFFARKTP